MIFLVRSNPKADVGAVRVVAVRATPDYAGPEGHDVFCHGSAEDADRLSDHGLDVVRLRDGWYEVGEGGVAVWGGGRFWELRRDPYTVAERSPDPA